MSLPHAQLNPSSGNLLAQQSSNPKLQKCSSVKAKRLDAPFTPKRKACPSDGEEFEKCRLDIDAVIEQRDERTTLMIRHIPNKYNQDSLLAEIDQNHAGRYNFFYLPVDFANVKRSRITFSRTVQAWDMRSSTSLTRRLSLIFILSTTRSRGATAATPTRFASCVTPSSRVVICSASTSKARR